MVFKFGVYCRFAVVAGVTMVSVVPMSSPSVAAAPVGAGFTLTVADVQFILKQIQISEAHATTEGGALGTVNAATPLVGTGPNDLPDPRLPWGLRQVDGRNNNLIEGRSTWGAADQPFPRATTPQWRDTEEPGYPTVQIGAVASSYDPAYRPSSVQDSTPRVVSNLIADQAPTNPAATAVAGQNAVMDADGSYLIANVAPNAGVAAPYNGMFALFGQFFDHGLDLVGKTGQENVVVPLQPDDPLYTAGSPTNFMIANRTILDANGNGANSTTPWVDQNQTYTAHPSHQVFLREYTLRGNQPVATGRLLDGAIAGNIGNWADVKQQALHLLGIRLADTDIFDVPLLLTDEYGRFLRGPSGFPQVVMNDATVVEGDLSLPVDTTNAMRTGHAFLDDIARTAIPNSGKQPDADTTTGNRPASGYYDDELLAAHFITGDGRGNENIGLTAIHSVFHSEHNRLVADVQQIVLANAASFLPDAWTLPDGSWNGERLFQTGRFVNEMEYQHLVFGEFARKIQPGIHPFVGYDATLRPEITAEYAHAVYRFGHSQLNSTVDRVNADGSRNDTLLLNAFLNPVAFNSDGKGGTLTAAQATGSIARGMTYQVGNEIDEFVTNTLRNSLLGLPLDLATLNIVRGRDTGMASLNGARRTFSARTGNAALAPYANWTEFSLALRHPVSAINFVAAYGTHPTILAATTVAAKRAAADKLVNDRADSPADRVEFMFGVGAWTDAGGATSTGLDDVDLWIGGLAEARNEFGGMLGSTFDYVFTRQMEQLQDGDRLYYITRTAGLNLGVELESNTLAEMIMRNSDVQALPGDAFAYPSMTFDMTAPPAAAISMQADGTWRHSGTGHVVFNGTAAADRVWSGSGDDTVRGNDGDDRIQGGGGDDNLVGGLGDDRLLDTAGIDILTGGDGNDYMATGGAGADLFHGGAGSDVLIGGNFPTTMLGGSGNDLIYGGDAGDIASGDDGADWIEGGFGADSLLGDIQPPFGVDVAAPDDDVIIGGSGDDVLNAGGGADISVGGAGVDIFIGGFGFDWQTYYDPNPVTASSVLADLNLFAPAPGDIVAGLMDGFDGVEGLSGGDNDDILRGDIRTLLTSPLTIATDILDPAHVAAMTNLQLLIGAGTAQWANGNILIGGRGNDLLEGRAGDDLLDGDAYLVVLLSVPANSGVTGTVDPATGRILVTNVNAVRQAVLDGTLNPSQVTIVRRIEFALEDGATDTAVFTGNLADYTISYVSPGRITIIDHIAGRDGTDTLRNIEQLQFLDMTVAVPVPSVPNNISSVSSSGGLTVSWTAPTRVGASPVSRYTVKVFNSADGSISVGNGCSTSGALTCTIGGLTNWATYYLEVYATNSYGHGATGPSTRLKATPGALPGSPATVSATPASISTAQVAWTPPVSTGGGTILGYIVTAYNALTAGVVVSTCSTTGALTCTLTGLPAGTTSYVSVVAINPAGTSAVPTPRVAITTLGAPTVPLSVTGFSAPSSAGVRWAAPVNDGGYPIISYTARAFSTVNGTVPVATCTVVMAAPTTPLGCTIPGLTNGLTYSIDVVATNSLVSGRGSTPRVSVKPALVPGSPATPTITATLNSLIATWTAPMNVGTVITGYTATVYTTQDGATSSGKCTTTGALTCTVATLAANTPYWVSVTATNSAGTGAPSLRTATRTVALRVPGSTAAPTVAPTQSTAVVSWVAPVDNGGSAITAYTVRAFNAAVGGTQVATCTTTGVLTCTLAGLAMNTAYWVEVAATNAVGQGVASPRKAITTAGPTVAGAPKISKLTPGNGTIAAVWTAPASNGGSAITSYVVRAYTTKVGGTVVKQCTTSGTLTCRISALARRTTYWVEVVAVNAAGTSAPSVRVTTKTT